MNAEQFTTVIYDSEPIGGKRAAILFVRSLLAMMAVNVVNVVMMVVNVVNAVKVMVMRDSREKRQFVRSFSHKPPTYIMSITSQQPTYNGSKEQ